MELPSIPFLPGSYVTVALFGLNYPGRVVEFRFDGAHVFFRVQYAQDGDLKTGEFFADELMGAA
mgnify:CR=1 FL=1